MATHLVFVYGTLRTGSWNHFFMEGQRLLGPAVTRERYALYVDEIPFVKRDEPASRIAGEVWEVDETCFKALDKLEEHPDQYRREQVEVELVSGETVTAWLYFHPAPTGRFAPSGDFFDYAPTVD